MKKILLTSALVLFLGFAFANAKGLTDAQIQAILGLIKGFGVPQEVVQKVENTLKGKPEISEMVSDALDYTCPKISRSLYLGARGEDVKELQEFLKKKGYFDYPEATGYFGTVTLKAVQKFQKEQGIVLGGEPMSTGFGIVGPKTKSYINSICKNSLDKPTFCTMEYDPVCGKKYPKVPNQNVKKIAPQYKTYSNMCQLKADGAIFAYKGACKQPISVCPQIMAPEGAVCTTRDGQEGTWQLTEALFNSCPQWKCVAKASDFGPVYISGPKTLKVGERGIWTISLKNDTDKNVYYEISWGDKKYSFKPIQQILALNDYKTVSEKFVGSHSYSEVGTYTIKVRLTRSDGSVAEGSTWVKVISSVPPSPYDGEKIQNLQSSADLYRLMDSSIVSSGTKYENTITATWRHGNIADDEWMALLLKDSSGVVHKAVKVDPSLDKASLQFDNFCNSYLSDAIDGNCQSIRKAIIDGKTFYLESHIYTPKDACFGYCAPNSPKPTILEKDRSEDFNIVLSDS